MSRYYGVCVADRGQSRAVGQEHTLELSEPAIQQADQGHAREGTKILPQ